MSASDSGVTPETVDPAGGAVLHLLFSAQSEAWLQCARLSSEGDHVVIVGPAVSALSRPELGEEYTFSCPVQVLGVDATAMGSEQGAELAGVDLISDGELVRLTEKHSRILSWT